MYPLKFYEIYKPKIWGGRAIEKALCKRLPEGKIGESWEISDHFDDVSVVRNGPLEGRTLRQVWREAPEKVLGEALSSRGYREFPLLVKFIDATATLSVQVHPDDEYARTRDPSGESGKNEAWYILAAEAGASLIAGVKPGTTKQEFVTRLEEKTLDKCLNLVDVAAGDLVHIAAGTVHAIGGGILLCEIQQTSDATYRVWDWGRVGADGKPRPLHIENALNVIDFQRGPVGTVAAQRVSDGQCRRDILDKCDYFVIERLQAQERFVEPGLVERFYIFICVGGSGTLVCEGSRYPYVLGDTILIPAAVSSVAVCPAEETTLLKTYIP